MILGGWASNNKYSFLGGLRSSRQLIAYEMPLGLGIIGVVLATGSLDLGDIITHQASSGVWTSPMKILAGGQLSSRKPTVAAAMHSINIQTGLDITSCIYPC